MVFVGQRLDFLLLFGGQAGHEVLIVSLSRTAAFVGLGSGCEGQDQRGGDYEVFQVHFKAPFAITFWR